MAEALLSQDEPSTSSAAVLAPEGQESFGVPTAMPRDKFLPVEGADYTESFMTQLNEVGVAGYGKVPIWAYYIDVPTRQRLVFRKEFINRRNVINMTNERHRRALQIYRTGAAQRRACANCNRGVGPFRKCVVDIEGMTFRGACTNCVVKEQGHDCQYHQKNRRQTLEHCARARENACIRAPINSTQPSRSPKRRRNSTLDHEVHANDDEPHSAQLGERKRRRTDTEAEASKGPRATPKGKLRRPSNTVTSLISSDVVFQGTTFKAGQASAEQVQYILKRCDADQKALFTSAWLAWCAEKVAENNLQPFDGIEAFLAEGWCIDLNEVISKVCPMQPKPRWTSEAKRVVAPSRQTDSSLERHRASFLRAWNAIIQAREESVISTAMMPVHGKPDPGNADTPRPSGQLQSPLRIAYASVKKDRGAKLSVEGKRKRQERSTSHERGKATSRKSTRKALNIPASPEPCRVEHEKMSDDDISQTSGDGLFVTPSAKSIWLETDFQQRPRFIPFPKRKSKRELALVVSAPDLPKVVGISKSSLKAASLKAFGPRAVRKIHESGPGVWLVRLSSRQEARDGVGKRLTVGSVEIVAEGIAKEPSNVFVWNPGERDVVPKDVNMADSLRQTFVRPSPEVEVQDLPRRVTVTFSECPQLLRLYLHTGDGRFARFDPLWLSR